MNRIIILTDLDATLLDYDNYDFGVINKFIEKLLNNDISIIPITSKTKRETIKFLRELNYYEAFSVENGGAVYMINDFMKFIDNDTIIKTEDKFIKKEFGINIEKLKIFLQEFSKKENIIIKTVFDISVSELSDMLNLSKQDLSDTLERDYDIPFLIESENEDVIKKLITKAEKNNHKIHKGGRFYHISGNYDKGDAVKFINKIYKKKYKKIITIGLGDSMNDFGLLKNVDYPILVRKKDLTICDKIKNGINNILLTVKPAPLGWKEGVEQILYMINYKKLEKEV